jgi:hypothetical protein
MPNLIKKSVTVSILIPQPVLPYSPHQTLLFCSLIYIVIALLVPTRKSAEKIGITVTVDKDHELHQVIPRGQQDLVPHQCLLQEGCPEPQRVLHQQALEPPKAWVAEAPEPPKHP